MIMLKVSMFVVILCVFLVMFWFSFCVIRVLVVIVILIEMENVKNRIVLVNLIVVVSFCLLSMEINSRLVKLIRNIEISLMLVEVDIIVIWWSRLFLRKIVCLFVMFCFDWEIFVFVYLGYSGCIWSLNVELWWGEWFFLYGDCCVNMCFV